MKYSNVVLNSTANAVRSVRIQASNIWFKLKFNKLNNPSFRLHCFLPYMEYNKSAQCFQFKCSAPQDLFSTKYWFPISIPSRSPPHTPHENRLLQVRKSFQYHGTTKIAGPNLESLIDRVYCMKFAISLGKMCNYFMIFIPVEVILTSHV